MLEIKKYRFYFCPCTQDLYGDEVLKHVAEHSAEVVAALNASDKVPFEVVLKPNLLTSDVIQATFNEANMDPECAGIITWAHTFSPSKNYIAGLRDLRKPLCQSACATSASRCASSRRSTTRRSRTTPSTWTS